MISLQKLQEAAAVWDRVAPIIRVPQTETEYEELCQLLDELVDATWNDAKGPLNAMIKVIGELIWNYEQRNHPWPDADYSE